MSEAEESLGYYDDEQKLTFDEAEILVERYLQQDIPRDVTRSKHVLQQFDYPYSDHNHLRIMDVLKRRCEEYHANKSGPKRFLIPEEYR